MKPQSMRWPEYVRRSVGRRLSTLGEWLEIDWLTYNPIQFRLFHELAVASAPGVMRVIASVFPEARFYADIGAGSGAYAAHAQREGIRVVACERSKTGRRWAKRQGVDCRGFDLTHEPPATLPGEIDLTYCFEVAEHLPAELGERLVQFIAKLAPIAVFSGAYPGQGGTGHINEQPKSYWIERFQSCGMNHSPAESRLLADGFRREAVPPYWLCENVMAFRR